MKARATHVPALCGVKEPHLLRQDVPVQPTAQARDDTLAGDADENHGEELARLAREEESDHDREGPCDSLPQLFSTRSIISPVRHHGVIGCGEDHRHDKGRCLVAQLKREREEQCGPFTKGERENHGRSRPRQRRHRTRPLASLDARRTTILLPNAAPAWQRSTNGRDTIQLNFNIEATLRGTACLHADAWRLQL